jgi:thiamine transport system substrate-binding protein
MRRVAVLVGLLSIVLAACADTESTEDPESLTLIAHDSFVDAVTDETFRGFADDTGIGVEVVAAGDAGSMVNQLVLTKDNPIADVAFGVDDTFLSRAIDQEIFVEYESPLLDEIAQGLQPESPMVTTIDFGDVCINYDKGWFTDSGLAVPTTLDELREPTYAALLTVEHPATSSPGLAFMYSTLSQYGEGWLDFWADLRDGGANVAPDWNTAYYSDFTRYGGSYPLVVSYASSPPAEVVFAEEPIEEAPTGVIEAGCFRQLEFAGVLANTDHEAAAGRLIDHMLSVEFQETIPLNWFVFPANREAALPEVFVENTSVPEGSTRQSYRAFEDRGDRIDQWIEVMEG